MKNLSYLIILMLLISAQFVKGQETSAVEDQLLPTPCNDPLPVLTVQDINELPFFPSTVNACVNDADGDGLCDQYEASGDFDGDGLDNINDHDSDNDGLSDGQEDGVGGEGMSDFDGDGMPNYLDLDADGDGVLDADENIECYSVVGVPPTGCPVNDRDVFWLHGYRGNELSFETVANKVDTDFKIRSVRSDYFSSGQSLQSAANNVEIDINNALNGNVNSANNFIIAHSMGGLVSRKMGRLTHSNANNTYKFNGLVTVGTPHQGVFAADVLVNEPHKLDNFLTEACQSLSAGPVLEGINSVPLIGPVAVASSFIGAATNAACDATFNTLIDPLNAFTANGIEGELTTTAVPNLPPMATDHNAIAYGIEEGHDDGSLTPRFIGALISSPNDYPLYGADQSDLDGILEFQDILTTYQTKETFFRDAANAINVGNGCNYWQLFWNPDDCGIIAVIIHSQQSIQTANNNIADAYGDGVDFLNDLDDGWQALIGARETALVPTTSCICYKEQFGEMIPIPACSQSGPCGTLPPSCNACDLRIEEVSYELVTTQKLSDGFILAESAANAPGRTLPVFFMEGSNHMQMKNDSKMQDLVEHIFVNGFGEPIDGFFKTNPR